ncbi:hypothetical protein AAF712_010090 [Marasmius tenuissimus]|uniref:pectinesterase n=1 Tax=Marasmius tenuissimus TaxID=585030 RepID=A0ABR2ZPG0_9AGAR
MFLQLFSFSVLLAFVQAASRTSPPSGAIVVRPGTSTSGEFKTITSALNSLPNDGSARSIFLFPGTYTEQVYVTRSGPVTIYGYTNDTSSYQGNQANIAFGLGADQAGNNDASGTLRVHSENFKLYNVNVRNTRGAGIQAIALSAQAGKSGFYGVGLYGYQDTLLANKGTQVYLKSYIEGKTDFIFGTTAQAYFGGNTIAVKGPSYITAHGRNANDASIYVFNSNTIVQAPGAESGTSGGYFFGRPWRPYAKVVFKNTVVNIAPKAGLWSLWNGDAASVSNTLFADYNTNGPAAGGITRASFAKLLSASEANAYTIASTVGSDYANWVDTSYVV